MFGLIVWCGLTLVMSVLSCVWIMLFTMVLVRVSCTFVYLVLVGWTCY